MKASDRFSEGNRTTWLGIWTNLFLSIFKISAGIVGKSHAMVADGFHSISDILAGGLVLASLRVSRKPIDETHPYGHGKAESIAAFIISFLLLFLVFGLSYKAIGSIFAGIKTIPGIFPLWAAIISLITKEAIFHYTLNVGKRLNSPAIMANAWEHRSDAITSGAALAGIFGARLGYYFLDPLAGFVVAIFILKTAYKVFRSAVRELMDHALPRAYRERIRIVASQVRDVKRVVDMKTRRMGYSNSVDLTIEVNPHLAVEEADDIAKQVKDLLYRELEHPGNIMVYVLPAEHDKKEEEMKINRISQILKSHSKSNKTGTIFHDLRIIHIGKEELVYFHLTIPNGMNVEEIYKLCADVENDIKKEFPELEISIKLEFN